MTTSAAFADARPFECRVVFDEMTRNVFVLGKVGDTEIGFAIPPEADFDVAKHLIGLRDALHATADSK